ncbi:MAG: superoxide dismutase [Bacteroidales bacterium]|nr:superoxide dismutase [Bacteroidales bacterium]
MILGAGALFLVLLQSSCVNTKGKDAALISTIITTDSEGFVQKELPYDFNALEPYIDAKTMELHYGKHHAGYTRKFNAALAEEGIETDDIYEIFSNISQYGPGVRNNGGGYFNHSLFWNFMSPDGGGQPEGELLEAIEDSFGSFDAFKELFSNAAATQFGSGWAWLIVDEEGALQVVATSNQDNPLMDIATVKGSPILNIDVWEHAYYLKYQNKRTEYISNFWNLVNWDTVSRMYKDFV